MSKQPAQYKVYLRHPSSEPPIQHLCERTHIQRAVCAVETKSPGLCVYMPLKSYLSRLLFVFCSQLVVDCLSPAMVITADGALPCQAVTPYSH